MCKIVSEKYEYIWKEEMRKWSDRFYEIDEELDKEWLKEDVDDYIGDPFKL